MGSAEWEPESRLTPERPTRSLRGTRERERTRLRLVNFLRWSSHPTAIGRYMKACRAPSPCHKATEENLSRIDTLAWSYPKIGPIRRACRVTTTPGTTREVTVTQRR